MSLTLQLVLGMAALMTLLGGIVWRSSYTFRRDFPEAAAQADRQRAAG